MSQTQTDVSQDSPVESEEQYQAFVRALKRRRGFGLMFVRCSPAEGERLIAKVRKDISQKTIDVLPLDEPIDNLYEIIDSLPNKDQIDILFTKGLEKSLVDYIKPGIGGQGDYYKEDTVPRILGHLNLQRERFRDSFNICFVFLLPKYALKYFIRRAPDFFDWRSGVVEFATSPELVQQESSQILSESGYEKYLELPPQERNQKIFEIQELLEENHQTLERKAELLFEQGNLFLAGKENEAASASYDKGLELQPDERQALYNQGIALVRLERYEAAIASFDKAIELQPDYHQAWYNRGIALVNLGRYEAAIASFDKAIELQPDFHQVWQAWFNRGYALGQSGRWEEALTSFDKALGLKPDYHQAWGRRGSVLGELGRYEEALASCDKALELNPNSDQAMVIQSFSLWKLGRFEETIASCDKALELNPDSYAAWNNRGIALIDLGRYEEALASLHKALEVKPDYQIAWYNKARCYALQGNVDLAIENLQQAINLNPDKYREMAKTHSDFDSIREDPRFQALIDG